MHSLIQYCCEDWCGKVPFHILVNMGQLEHELEDVTIHGDILNDICKFSTGISRSNCCYIKYYDFLF